VLEALELARTASPAMQAHAGSAPFHLAHGEDDTYVPVDQSRRLMLALLAVGVDAHLDVVPAAGHFWLGKDDTTEQFDAAIEFARSVTRD
jgi:dipeptidyl aminopeptidase/acylaminoacyl peptidase